MNTEKRDHHFVPRHYLKGFTDSTHGTSVWVYRKGQSYTHGGRGRPRNPTLTAVKSAGAVKDYYAMETVEGQRIYEAYEDRIGRQEEIGIPILRKMRRREALTLSDKVAFSFYIDLMMDRVPDRAKRAAPLIKKALSAFPYEMLARKAADEGRFALARRFL